MGWLLLALVKIFSFVLNLMPLEMRQSSVFLLLRFYFGCFPSYYRVSMKNLNLAFPERDDDWKQKVYLESLRSLSRVVVDFLRLPYLDSAWVQNHVSCPSLTRYKELKNKTERGVIVATGHLGSFEIIAFSAPVLAQPVAFVARDLKPARLNAWIKKVRERTGNYFISRNGAMPRVLKHLNNGTDVGILFDQNVRKEQAVFVPWFGRPAATSRALAVSAIRTKAVVVVASIRYLGDDHYEIEMKECDFESIYSGSQLSQEQKIEAITNEVSAIYQRMIISNPSEWFWFHRRWKTPAPGTSDDLYRDI
jgi:KDO2-lipid IV(A) lauroyltransferase